MFQLNKIESEHLARSQFVTAQIRTIGNKGGRTSLPYAFTEQGIYMLMTVLRGELAIKQSKTLKLLKCVSKDIDITIISDNIAKDKINQIHLDDFKSDTGIEIKMIKSHDIVHDRFIVIDYKTDDEKLFLCGSSSKDTGNKITTIIKIENIEIYHTMVDKLLGTCDKLSKMSYFFAHKCHTRENK